MINTRKLTAITLASCIITMQGSTTNHRVIQHLDLKLPATDSKKQKSRMRKSSGKREPTSYRDMGYQKLSVAKDKLVAQENSTTAVKYLYQLIKLCDPEDVATIGKHLLEIADLLFKDKQFLLASQKYAEFALLHPGSESVEYALYRTIISSFNCTLAHDRDQTKTEETLSLAENFLKQDHFTQYAADVTVIAQQCREKLIDSELTICEFHIKRGNFTAAHKRIATIKDAWPIEYALHEHQVVALETDIVIERSIRENKQKKFAENKHAKRAKRMTERF